MTIYDSFGVYDVTKLEFNLAAQTTNIDTDLYEIKEFYDICNTTRYAILAILKTKDGDYTDFSTSPADCACMISDVKFTDLDQGYLNPGDKDIFGIQKGETIDVVVHHAIGFDPLNNPDDDLYIKNYKAGTYIYYPNASKPGKGGKGIMI